MSDMHFREPNQVKWQGSRPGHNGDQVLEDGSVSNGELAIYTVPAGQRAFITGITFHSDASGGAGSGAIRIYNAVPALVCNLFYTTQRDAGPINDTGNFWPPIELPAAWSIRVWSNNAVITAYGAIHGWVE